MIFKKLPIIYTRQKDDNNNYMEFREGMSATFDTEPFDKEIVLQTYVNVPDLISIILRPVLASDGTIIERQTLLEHGENFMRAHWIIDLPMEEVKEILTQTDENIFDV